MSVEKTIIFIESYFIGGEPMKRVEYMCSYCGKKQVLNETQGRPMPGKCPRKQGDKPHSWRKNRTW